MWYSEKLRNFAHLALPDFFLKLEGKANAIAHSLSDIKTPVKREK